MSDKDQFILHEKVYFFNQVLRFLFALAPTLHDNKPTVGGAKTRPTARGYISPELFCKIGKEPCSDAGGYGQVYGIVRHQDSPIQP